MGGIVGVLIGLPVATFGFLVMRNPMKLTLLAPWQEGYYQRMVLDTAMRIQLRILGLGVFIRGQHCLGVPWRGIEGDPSRSHCSAKALRLRHYRSTTMIWKVSGTTLRRGCGMASVAAGGGPNSAVTR